MPPSNTIAKPFQVRRVTRPKIPGRLRAHLPPREPPVQHSAATGVRLGVIARTTPNHPLRVAALFGASLAFFAIVGSAAGALTWVVQDVRASRSTAPITDVPKQADLNLPAGVIALQRATDASEFELLAGFAPFVPKKLPEHTRDDLSLSVALPDDNGVRAGRVGLSSDDVAGDDGVSGPIVVLWETKGAPDASAAGEFAPLPGKSDRVLVATVACRDLTLKLELYFHPAAAPGDPVVTPYMTDTASSFLDGIKKQCGG